MEPAGRIDRSNLMAFTCVGIAASSLSLVAVVLYALQLAEPVTPDNFLLPLGAIHAIALAPAFAFKPSSPARLGFLCGLAACFGAWAMGAAFVLVFLLPLMPLVWGLIWSISAGIVLKNGIATVLLGGSAFIAFAAFMKQLSPPFGIQEDFATVIPAALWHAAATASTYVALWMGINRRAERMKATRCVACNYSLTGLTTNTCPECGEPITAPQSPQAEA